MDIIILADFCGKMDGTGNSRFLYLAEMLSAEHTVEIVTSDFDHGTKSYFKTAPAGYPFKITMLHEGYYSRNVSLKRFRAHYVWGKNVEKYLKTRKKPDVIYAAIPPLYASYVTARYCEEQGIRFVIDVQDLWPEAFQMVFRVPGISTLAFFPFKHCADFIYSRADSVCAVSKTYADRALQMNRKTKRGHIVYLGTDLSVFDRNVKNNPVSKPDNEFWIGYCGTLGASYDLTVVIDALAIIKDKGVDSPELIVVGKGERREEFEKHAAKLGVKNRFLGFLPYEEMCGWIAQCDAAVNPITHGAAQSIINKHADYASAGIPVVSTQESPEYRELVESYNMGFNCNNNDPEDLAGRILLLMQEKELRETMGRNARRCAEEKFDRKYTYQSLINAICTGDETE